MGTKNEIIRRVQASQNYVFLRADFADLGNYNQIGRALRQVVADGVLARISRGVYAKVRPSVLDPSKLTLSAPGGFKQVSREALDRLGIKWRPSAAEDAYNKGLSTQIPAKAPVSLIPEPPAKYHSGQCVCITTEKNKKNRSISQRSFRLFK